MMIYTIGHSTRNLEEMVEILKAYKIDLLVDVRTVPRSRHTPQFNLDNLTKNLPKVGTNYQHLAALGGLRHTKKDSINMGWHNLSFRGYADYMQTSQFASGIDELLNLVGGGSASSSDAVRGSQEERASRTDGTASERKTPADAAMRRARRAAIMCAEAVPWRCHRSMIGDALIVRGFDVIDIFDAKKSQPEKLTSFAVVSQQKITYPEMS